MCSKKSVLNVFLLVALVGFSSWGFLVHRTIHQIAIYNLPEPMRSYFYTDMDNLVANAPRPDIRRNKDKTEDTKHFIDLEAYGPNAANEMPFEWDAAVKKYGKDSLIKWGWGPYNAMVQLDNLTAAFKSNNKDSILFYAADLGHYVADLHVPLHTTMNYDGQLTGQKGLHSLWETFIPEINLDQFMLYNTHQAKYIKNPAQALWVDIRKANLLVPQMLAIETEVTKQFTPETKYRNQMRYGKEVKSYTKPFAEAYAKALGNTVNVQLIASANMIADFWYTAWVNAGKPQLTLTRDANGNLAKELASFKQNKLIQDGLLISKKDKPED